MKKIAILVAIFAIALTANMAFARDYNNDCGRCDHDWDHEEDQCPCPSITVNNGNSANVSNMVMGMSNTGMNMSFGGDITTGNATNASYMENWIGKNETYIGSFSDKTSVTVNNSNGAGLSNVVFGVANTGKNMATGMMLMTKTSRCRPSTPSVVGGDITTGNAENGSGIINYVGSSVTKIGCPGC